MKKKIAILQSNYIPWKGYFDIINRVDEFVLYDEMQYTRRDWRNRNQIKSANGLMWLTIPVEVKNKYCQKINETRVASKNWADKHLKSIELNYKKAHHYSDVMPLIENWYSAAKDFEFLSQINVELIKQICHFLEITTPISSCEQYKLSGDSSEKLLNICLQADADTYLSGPAAKGYLQLDTFVKQGVKVEWMDYSHYPAYSQLFGEFEHAVSVLDMLFNCGKSARSYILRSL